MSGRPFMPMHVGGFVASTLALDAECIGAYSLILMAAWQQGGSLPADMQTVGSIARVPADRWADVWPELSGFFDITDARLVPLAFTEWAQAKARIFGRAPLPASLRAEIMERDGEQCRYCGTAEGPFHIDHMHPVALGGTDHPDNLAVACKRCNLSKGAKTIEEWLP